ncbi:MAG: Do family serine endopeptidase, partial [Chlamydiales bacterium]|nr:Do family serine endopeptidase [Chlamydiales bacterium]
GTPPQRGQQPQMTSGSGFLISSDGYIVTNHHVIKNAKEITIVLNDGEEFTATVKGFDPRTDLAVVKIEGNDFPFLQFGNSDEVDIGEWAIAIGNPFGLEASLTVGVISAKGRQDLGIAAFEDFIQTDAAINPGNSGGALLNLHGEVIGVNTAILSRNGGYMGIGLSIPSKMAQYITDQIIREGIVKRAYLGVLLQPIDKQLAEAMSLEKQEGVLIAEIVKDSPAEKAGLKQGDIILSYNNKPVKTLSQFRNDIAMMSPGSPVVLAILRNGKTLKITASTGSQSEGDVASAEIIQKLGLEIDTLTPEFIDRLGYPADTSGVLITRVKPGSIAAAAGLRPSLVITGVATDLNSQQKVRNIEEFEKALETVSNKKYIILIVRGQNCQYYYTMKLN